MEGGDYRFVEEPGASPWVVERAAGAGLLLEGVKKLMRVFSRAIYVFPALALVKLVWRGEGSDAITLVFVGIVVVFFALLATFLLLFPLVGPRSARRVQRRFVPATTLPEATRRLALSEPVAGLPTALDGAVEGSPPLRLRGTLERLDRRGATRGRDLLRDTWTPLAARTFECASFAVLVGDVPVVVQLEVAPACVGQYVERDDGSRTLAFHDGDQVELVATSYRALEDIEDVEIRGQRWTAPAGAAAYRSGRTGGLHVVCRTASPVVIAAC